MFSVFFKTLGCPKNEVDSDVMMGILKEENFQIIDEPDTADVIVINTCGFIRSAKEESINTILEMADFKEFGKCRYLIVTGCLSERYRRELEIELPEVDAFLGTRDFGEIGKVTKGLLENDRVSAVNNCSDLQKIYKKRRLILPEKKEFFSYLKVAEGCNNWCSYCIIPKLRGKYTSRPLDDILEEARLLVETGTKEIILVAQDTTSYGIDLYGQPRLAFLLQELAKIKELELIRIMYSYPTHLNDELIEVIAREEKIVNYLDLPLQHSHPEILKRMNRPYKIDEVEELIEKLKRKMPDLVLRTSLIVGFPGEGEEEFDHLVRFVQRIRFDRLGVFTYSREEGTKAFNFPDQIPEEIKEERQSTIMEIQQNISLEKNKKLAGKTLPVIIEEIMDKNFRKGRTFYDAPEIDNGVLIKSDARPGEVVNMKITGAEIYDLIGEEI